MDKVLETYSPPTPNQEEKREDLNKIRNERQEIIIDTTEIGKKPLEITMNN